MQLIMLLFAFFTNKFLIWLHRGTPINILDENYSISIIRKFVCSTILTEYDKQTQRERYVLNTKKVLFVVLGICSIFFFLLDIVNLEVALTNKKFDLDQIIIFVFSFFLPTSAYYCCNLESYVIKMILFFLPYYGFACYVLAFFVWALPFSTAVVVQGSLAFFAFCFGLTKRFEA